MSTRMLLWCSVAVGCLAGCRGGTEPDLSRPSSLAASEKPMLSPVEREGEEAFARYCVGCHGVDGNGKGEGARFLNPKPRNFQLANFKFSSTRSGQLPTDEDLRRTIRKGLRGSAMPPFELLPESTVDSLIAYVKTFSPKWREKGPGVPIPMVEDPYRLLVDKTEAVERGKLVYHGFMTCWSCHPSYQSEEEINASLTACGLPPRTGFRQHLTQAEGKVSNEGDLVFPPDFLRDDVRSGMTTADLYRSISAGITGTAMPTWVDTLTQQGALGAESKVQPSDLWAVSYYVQDLLANRPRRLAEGQATIRDRAQGIYLHGEPPPVKPAAQAEEEEFVE